MSDISFSSISEKASQLETYYQQFPAPQTLREKIIYAYHKKTLSEFKVLTEEKLKQYLYDNWSLIKGTSLCYTAIPEDEVTKLLCNAAEWLSNDQEGALNLLMPTVNTESLSNDYPNLGSYQDERGVSKVAPVELSKVLQTHILGREGYYLIPVHCLVALESETETLNNVYFDFTKHKDEMSQLNEEERRRLFEHSKLTEALQQGLKAYAVYVTDNGGLLEHLEHLYRILDANSVNGSGQELNAGWGVYSGIIQFNDYYRKLDKAERQRIPEDLSKEINYLLNLSSDKDLNITEGGQINIDTCLARRAHGLGPLIKKYAGLLSTIGIKGDSKERLIENAKKEIKENQHSIEQHLNDNTYRGRDKLSLTLSLLTALNVDLFIHSPADFNDFLNLSAQEIDEFCQDQSVRTSLRQQFYNIEELLIFCIETTPDRIKIILSHLVQDLRATLIRSHKDVSALLMGLDEIRFRIVCNELKVILPTLITSNKQFNEVLRHISPEQCVILCDSLQETLPKLITSSTSVGDVICYLNPEQCAAVCGALKETLSKLLTSGSSLGDMLRHRPPQQCIAFCDALKDPLSKLFTSASEFVDALRNLYPEQCTAVCSVLQEPLSQFITSSTEFDEVLLNLNPRQCAAVCSALSQLIPSTSEFSGVLQNLSPKQCAIVCDALQEHLSQLITSAADFGEALRNLSLEQCAAVCSAWKKTLPRLIKSASNFGEGLRNLSPEQCAAVCSALKETLPRLIKSASDFGEGLHNLSSEQCTAVCSALKETLPKIITSSYAFNTMLHELTPEQRTVVYEAMKENLPKIITSIYTLKEVLFYLSPEQGAAVCDAWKCNFYG